MIGVIGHRKKTPSKAGPKESENIKVMVRVRPPLDPRHSDCSDRSDRSGCIEIQENAKCIVVHQKHRKYPFTFDHVASPHSTQSEMMKCVGRPIADKVLEGYNGTIFAYGQTGSGKSYTMSGEKTHHFGLMPNIFSYLFKRIEKDCDSEHSVKVSCCELYNDHITDLLDAKQSSLTIREDVRRNRFFVEGLSEKQCESAQQCFNYVGIARWFRQTKATKMNASSSRSHLIFTVTLTKRTTDSECNDPRKKVHAVISRLNMVDLAGSERQSRSQATGPRLKEAKYINGSLSELGLVIQSLVKRQRHIPYNNSKLTKLLKDSLGGSSMTFMIANVSPSPEDLGETLSTLQFADRAKQIRNTAKRNSINHLSLEALKAENSKFVDIVEDLNAKYEAATKKFKMQRRKSVELTGKLKEFSKKNTELSAEVNTMKSQREIALELSAKIFNEQNKQIAALQKQLAEKTMFRSTTGDRFMFNSPGYKKKRPGARKTPKRSSSHPMPSPLSTITTQTKALMNSSEETKDSEVSEREHLMENRNTRSSVVLSGDCESFQCSNSSDIGDLDDEIEKAQRDLKEMKMSPVRCELSGLGSESESFM